MRRRVGWGIQRWMPIALTLRHSHTRFLRQSKGKYEKTAQQAARKSIAAAAPAFTTSASTDEQDRLSKMVLEGASVFVGGKAGTGKSFFLRRVIQELELKGRKVAVAGSTGVAALNIGGNTFHSVFGVPVDARDSGAFSLSWERVLRPQALLNCDVIIVDEVSFLHGGYLELLDKVARRVASGGRAGKKPFGGLQVILSGDFLQLTSTEVNTADQIQCLGVEKTMNLPPQSNDPKVQKTRKDLDYYRNLSMYESYAFQNYLLHVEFLQSHRHHDSEFVKALNKLRIGVLPKMIAHSAVINEEDPSAVRLFATKNAVRQYNGAKMLQLNGDEYWFPSEISVRSEDNFETDSVHSAISDVLLLHLRSEKKSGQLLHASEVRRVIVNLANTTGTPLPCIKWCILPRTAVQSTSPVAVRFCGNSKQQCDSYLKKVSSWAIKRVKNDESLLFQAQSKKSQSTEDNGKSCFIVRQSIRSIAQVAALVKHSVDQRLLRSVRNDYALGGKTLKNGCRVMLLRNVSQTYVNGSLGTIVGFTSVTSAAHKLPQKMKGVPQLNKGSRRRFTFDQESDSVSLKSPTVSTSPFSVAAADSSAFVPISCVSREGMIPLVQMDIDHKVIAVPYLSIPFQSECVSGFYTMYVNAMPLTPAYAFTVHKVQGLTFNFPILFDASGLFPCDHIVYVAASRVTRFSFLRIVNLSPKMITIHTPSLRFSFSLSTIDKVERVWESFKAGDRSSSCRHLYFPSWIEKEQLKKSNGKAIAEP